jgi:dTMP kinase
MKRGRFIVLEGLDGAGTTTQADRLGTWLRARGRRVHVTAEPTGGPIGGLIRLALSRRLVGHGGGDLDPEALALLFAADRLDHLASDIEPKLRQGIDVVSDRYVLSSLAYQGLTCDPRWVADINARARPPDLTVFLEVGSAVAYRRRRAASFNREIFEFPSFQKRVAVAYARALKGLKRQRVAVVDGEMAVEAVARAVAARVEKVL